MPDMPGEFLRSIQIRGPREKDFGGVGDCGWRSIAAAYIDKRSARLSRDVENDSNGNFSDAAILQAYRDHYPNDFSGEKLSNFDDLLSAAVNSQERLVGLVPKLGYVIRQLAVSEMVKHPADYVGAFADKNEETSPEAMRRNNTWIDESGLLAAARVLNTPLKVCSDKNLIIPDRVYNEGSAQQPRSKSQQMPFGVNNNSRKEEPITINFKGSHYVPQLITNCFEIEYKQAKSDNSVAAQQKPAAQTETPQPKPVQYNDPSLEKIWRRIEEAENLDKEREAAVSQKLQAYTNQELIGLYKEAMQSSDYLPGKIKAITREYGGKDKFFEQAIEKGEIASNRAKEIREILIHSLAKEEYIHPHSPVEQFLRSRGQELSSHELGQETCHSKMIMSS